MEPSLLQIFPFDIQEKWPSITKAHLNFWNWITFSQVVKLKLYLFGTLSNETLIWATNIIIVLITQLTMLSSGRY